MRDESYKFRIAIVEGNGFVGYVIVLCFFYFDDRKSNKPKLEISSDKLIMPLTKSHTDGF